ncbi:hypothetical protein L1765_12510 [Microaerobacter geothermalis]|uniref:hypothetical protein n=1 Tax=Microaerobacter geothermalis TaxID=674972 RepID=UPI001F351C9F|nr:hypothetical protein [Microaerobacter geothermalis]MCF6094781.1 hypothetical protein [Microaerobacter geothermalis]
MNPPEKLPSVFEITPQPAMENGWYVINENSTIRLKGFTSPKSVRFQASIPSAALSPIDLGIDNNPSDGWTYKGPLLGEGDTVIWAVVTELDGNTVFTPVLPVMSGIQESVNESTQSSAGDNFENITEPQEVVKEYFKLTSRGDYQSAWNLLHPSLQNHPSRTLRISSKQQFMALQGTKGPDIKRILGEEKLETYKIYSLQILVGNVAAVNIELNDGEEKTVHLLQDKENRWRLFWEPDRGLE